MADAINRSGIEVSRFKDIVAKYPTGVVVMTTNYLGQDFGITVNSFTSVSLDPMLILFCIDKKSGSYEAFINCSYFIANMLAINQEYEAKKFASKGIDKFKDGNYSRSRDGNILIDDIYAYLELKKYQALDAGDHTIVIGEVINGEMLNDKSSICYSNRRFMKLLD